MRLITLALSILLCATFVNSQSLGELAKKEKERRKDNGREAAVEVDQNDVANGVVDDSNDDAEVIEEVKPIEARDANDPSGSSEEDDWDEVYKAFQERYQKTKTELDKEVAELERMKAQCSANNMGEPTIRQKEKGVRQEGLPVGLIAGEQIQYGSCDTVDFDLKAAKEKRSMHC